MKKISIKTTLDLDHTLFCGQAFRWKKNEDYYEGVVDSSSVKLFKDNDMLFIESNKDEEFWRKYFRIYDDFDLYEEKFSALDDNLKKAIDYSKGLRLLKQDEFEMLLSFIISSNNNIKRITSLIEKLSKSYGNQIDENNYSFPTAEQLKDVKVEDYRKHGFGYRDKFLKHAVDSVNNSVVDLNKIHKLNSNQAKEELIKIKGIGEKVASCILLFGYSKDDVFPIDTWIKKAINELYPDKLNEYDTIEDFYLGYFGDKCGIAQQYLFHYMRNK